MIKSGFLLSLFIFIGTVYADAQINYGTTGLMNMPTADMQRDKNFMAGGNWLNHHATVPRWWYDTWNYYINITIFPWLEAGYLCMGHKAVPTDYGNRSGYWVPSTYGKFINQDRSFHFRLRVWKEGWWKAWTPQVVIGANDPGSHSSNGGGDIDWGGGGSGNHNYLTRYYLAATKHVEFSGIGTVGVHVAWVIGKAMSDVHYSRPAAGVNFHFGIKGEGFWQKALNGFNLMAEVCPGHAEDLHTATYTVNVGGTYSIWKDHINLIAELNDGKFFSGGIFFKLHLK